MEMTRKRTRENLMQQLCEPCSYCEGRGYVLSAESVAYKVLREIRKDLPTLLRPADRRDGAPARWPRCCWARRAGPSLPSASGWAGRSRCAPGPAQHQEQFEVTALDEGPPVELPGSWLSQKRRRRRLRMGSPEAAAMLRAGGRSQGRHPKASSGAGGAGSSKIGGRARQQRSLSAEAERPPEAEPERRAQSRAPRKPEPRRSALTPTSGADSQEPRGRGPDPRPAGNEGDAESPGGSEGAGRPFQRSPRAPAPSAGGRHPGARRPSTKVPKCLTTEAESPILPRSRNEREESS